MKKILLMTSMLIFSINNFSNATEEEQSVSSFRRFGYGFIGRYGLSKSNESSKNKKFRGIQDDKTNDIFSYAGQGGLFLDVNLFEYLGIRTGIEGTLLNLVSKTTTDNGYSAEGKQDIYLTFPLQLKTYVAGISKGFSINLGVDLMLLLRRGHLKEHEDDEVIAKGIVHFKKPSEEDKKKFNNVFYVFNAGLEYEMPSLGIIFTSQFGVALNGILTEDGIAQMKETKPGDTTPENSRFYYFTLGVGYNFAKLF